MTQDQEIELLKRRLTNTEALLVGVVYVLKEHLSGELVEKLLVRTDEYYDNNTSMGGFNMPELRETDH